MSSGAVFPPRNLPGPGDNWGRHVQDRIVELERAVDVQNSTVGNQGRSNSGALTVLGRQVETIANQQTQIAAVVASLPVTAASSSVTQPTSANSSNWTTKASTSLVVPSGKSQAVIMGIGTVALLDTVSGGIANLEARLVVHTATGVGVPSAKDTGANVVNNVVAVNNVFSGGVSPGSTVTVSLQVRTFHSTAFAANSASNFAQVAATATFS